jgi:radical SAM protein with 4Fe4S-binding SPASM domain
LTNRCNLACIHCLADAGPTSAADELDTREWLELIRLLKTHRVINVSLSGGEIFIRSDIFELLRALKEGNDQKITLITNGTLINDRTAAELKALRLRSVVVSVDGLQSSNDRIRGTGAYSRTIAGLLRLLEADRKPVLSCTPMRHNIQELAPLIDEFYGIGVRAFRFNTLTPEGRCAWRYPELAPQFPDDIAAIAATVRDKVVQYPDAQIHYEGHFFLWLKESGDRALRENRGGTPPKHLFQNCGVCKTSCHVRPNGDVVPCGALSDFRGGNVRTQDFLAIWRDSEAFARIRETAGIDVAALEICGRCKYNPLCDAGCRAAAYCIAGDLRAPDPACPFAPAIQAGLPVSADGAEIGQSKWHSPAERLLQLG